MSARTVVTPINLTTMENPAKMAKLDAAIPLGRMAQPQESLGLHPDHLIPRCVYLNNEIPVAGVVSPSGDMSLRKRLENLGP